MVRVKGFREVVVACGGWKHTRCRFSRKVDGCGCIERGDDGVRLHLRLATKILLNGHG